MKAHLITKYTYPKFEMPLLSKDYKWIPEYEGLYAVSESGSILSYMFSYPKKLKHFKSGLKGYPSINLYKLKPLEIVSSDFNPSKMTVVANLVLRTWGPPQPSPKHIKVNYIDGNINNIHVSNLEWTSQSEIMRKSIIKTWKNNTSKSLKPKKPIILLVDGITNAQALTKGAIKRTIDTGKDFRENIKVFTPEGYLNYIQQEGLITTTKEEGLIHPISFRDKA